ncbi:TPA: hypothetical protein EYP12_03480 [Candidatus Bipolaricaulota bacterium]|nr:hypothetical protein [Candidatus Bipolaricaulota bacterium]
MRKPEAEKRKSARLSREEFFRELFTLPGPVEYDHHPGEKVLRAYLAGRLGDEWHFDEAFIPRFRRADLNGDWGLSEVSMHLLTCSLCRGRIARLRAEELMTLEDRAKTSVRAGVEAREAETEEGLLHRLQAFVRRRLNPGREHRPVGEPRGLGRPRPSPRLPSPAFDLPLGVSALSPANLSLLYQRPHSGLGL